jgi:hypothetical protein
MFLLGPGRCVVTDTKPAADLDVVEALRLAQTDAAELVHRLRLGWDPVTDSGRILHGPSLWPTKAKPVRERLFWHRWTVHEEHDEDAVLATGHRLTMRGAWRKEGRVQRRIGNERRAAREAEAEE